MQSYIFSIITPVFNVTWSFRNQYNMLKKHFLLLSLLKTVVLLKIFVETIIKKKNHDSLMNRKLKLTAFIWQK